MTKDYYKILDIPEFSSEQEIKTAYRKLARKWHPDVAGNSDEVISKFKDINEAYEVLSNRVKKADYDTAKRFYDYAKGEKAYSKTTAKTTYKTAGASTKPDFKKNESKTENKFNWEKFFNEVNKEINETFGTNNKTKNSQPQKGKDIYSDIEISMMEAVTGTVKVINMLQTQVCQKCGGRKFVNGIPCPHCNGKGEKSNYKRFSVKIPAGIKNLSKIRLSEEGEKGINGGRNGDLYLTIHIKQKEEFKTEGLNILKNVEITPADAVLGANINVSTLNGNISVKISPNTRNGQKIRLSNCGMELNGKYGDMIITISIQIPKNLTNEEINLYKKLQELNSEKI